MRTYNAQLEAEVDNNRYHARDLQDKITRCQLENPGPGQNDLAEQANQSTEVEYLRNDCQRLKDDLTKLATENQSLSDQPPGTTPAIAAKAKAKPKAKGKPKKETEATRQKRLSSAQAGGLGSEGDPVLPQNPELEQRRRALEARLRDSKDVQSKLQGEITSRSSVAYKESPDGVLAGEHAVLVQKLREVLSAMGAENVSLREEVRTGYGQAQEAPVQIVAERFVGEDVLTEYEVSIEENRRIEMIIDEKKVMEQEFANREAEWRAQCEKLKFAAPKVKVEVKEMPRGPVSDDLQMVIRQKETDVSNLKRRLSDTASQPKATEKVTIERDRIVEVPILETRTLEFESTERLEELQRLLGAKDAELEGARENLRRVELEQQNALTARMTTTRSAALPQQPAELAPEPAGPTVPQCPSCRRGTVWTEYSGGAYQDSGGWECSNFRRCGQRHGTKGFARFCCQRCLTDFCLDCAPLQPQVPREVPTQPPPTAPPAFQSMPQAPPSVTVASPAPMWSSMPPPRATTTNDAPESVAIDPSAPLGPVPRQVPFSQSMPPQQLGYGTPQQPGYGTPQQPGYGMPQQQGYGQPAPGRPNLVAALYGQSPN